MTGQPKTDEELTNATQNANAELSEQLANGEIERGFDDEDDSEKTDDEKLDELRNFRENAREQANDEIGAYGEPQTDETEMEVEDYDGETYTYTREEWKADRSTRTRVWDRLERNGGVYVQIAHWFSDPDVNAVKVGKGFYAEKVDETDKAYKFVCEANSENHTAESREVWMPKKAARIHRLKD
jgi:hypothetical protein